MPTYTATDYEAVSPGLYTARLEHIEEAASQHGIYYRWCFVIEDEGEQADRKVYANVSDKFGPQSLGPGVGAFATAVGCPQLGQKRSSSLSSAPQFVQYL